MPFSHVDVVPTLLGLARLPIPQGVSGKDLSGHLLIEEQGGVLEGAVHPESVYLQSYTPTEQSGFPPWRGVRTERYTYARHEDRPWLMYDNETDPFQKDNLVAKPEHAELEAKLDAMTMDWFNKTGDNWRERSDLPYR
jgi:arylsulfatase A-like enzyme